MQVFQFLVIFSLVSACENGKSKLTDPKGQVAAQYKDWVVKSYETNPEYGEESVKALNKILASKPVTIYLDDDGKSYSKVSHVIPGHGRAWLAAAGLVALNASPEIHAGVPDLLRKIANSEAKLRSSVITEIWAFGAVPSKTKNPLSEDLEAVFKNFRASKPDLCIVELDHIKVPSLDSRHWSATSEYILAKGTTAIVGGQMMADLKVRGLSKLQSRIKSNPGETIVVLESKSKARKFRDGAFKRCGVKTNSVRSLHSILAIKLSAKE